MSLDALDTRITNNRAQAQQLNADAQASYARIRNDPTLSAQGKRDAIARTYLEVKPKVNALQDDEAKAISDTQNRLTRAVFGTSNTDPQNLINYRDAQDRAALIDDPNTALALMNRALLNQDSTLASAILERAIAYNWFEVSAAFAAANPTLGDSLNDLSTLNRLATPQARFNATMAYITPAPDELASASAELLQQLSDIGAWGLPRR